MVRLTSTKKAIVKRAGHAQVFDERKIYASVYAAAINTHYTEKDAEKLANSVCKVVVKSLKSKKVLSSLDIKAKIISTIPDKNVVLMYKHHMNVC